MTSIYRTGRPYSMGIAIETTPGTYVAPATGSPGVGAFIPYQTDDFDPGITDTPYPGHTGYRDSNYQTFRDKVDPKSDIKAPAWPGNGLEQLLYLLLGAKSVAGVSGVSGAYVHTLTQANTLPTASITKWANLPGLIEPFAWEMCMLNELKIDMPQPGLINLDANFLTNEVDLSQTTQPTQSFANTVPFQFGQCAMQMGTPAAPQTLSPINTVTKFSLDIKNNVSSEHMMDQTLNPNLKIPEAFDVMGHIEFPYGNQSEMAAYLSGTSVGTSGANTVILNRALQLVATSSNMITGSTPYMWTINLPILNYKGVKLDDSGKNSVKYAFDFQGKFNAASSSTINMLVQSGLATIT